MAAADVDLYDAVTAPSSIPTTVPFSWFLALSFMRCSSKTYGLHLWCCLCYTTRPEVL